MLLGDVFFHIFHSHPSVAYVLIPLCERTVTVEFYRLMMHPVPILKLHIVDVIAVEVIHDGSYILIRHGTVGGQETVTRITDRIG